MHKYLKETHIQKLGLVETFDDLADIALEILHEMSRDNKSIVEICGPISTGGAGNIEENIKRFNRAIKIAGEKGMIVFDQIIFEKSMERIAPKYPMTDGYHLDILEIFYRKIFSSGYIKIAMFLPDWQSSKGATWERNLVAELGLEIVEFPIEWFDDFK